MAEIVQTPIRSVYKDGSIVVSNVKSKIDNTTTSYSVVNTWHDGTPMDDSKVDQFGIYSKYKPTGEYLRENKPQWGEQFLEVDTVAELRDMTPYNQFLIRIGYFKGVRLSGYYVKGDTPGAINYLLSNTPLDEDGGSVFEIGLLKYEHIFYSEVYFEYFGIKSDGSDVSNEIGKVFKYASDNNLLLKGSEGKTYIFDDVVLQGLSSFSIDSKSIFKRMDNMLPYPEGSTMLNATSTLKLLGCKGIKVISMKFDGNARNNNCLTEGTTTGSYNWGNYFQEFRHCLTIEGDCSELHFDNIITDNPSGDGVYLKGLINKDIYIKNITGSSVDENGDIYPVGRNLVSIIQGANYTFDNIISNGIGHQTMPSGLDIEPNSGQSVKNVQVGNYYNRSLGMSGLGITTKYGGGLAIQDVYIKSAYIDNQKDVEGTTVRTVVLTGNSNVVIDNLFVKGGKTSYALHIGIAGEAQPCFNLQIKNAVLDTCRYGAMIDNLTGGFIKANVVNCYENMYRLYQMQYVDFDVTGNFAADIDTSGEKNFALYFNQASTKAMTNCTFSGDLSVARTGPGLGHRAVNANNASISQISRCSFRNLNLDGWIPGSKIVGNNIRLRQENITNIINRGPSTALPLAPEVHGHRFWDETSFSWKYWNSSRWRPFTTNDYTLSNSSSAILPNEGGVHTWENNYALGECVLTIPLSARYSVGSIFILKNNQNQNVRLRGDVGITIQSSTSHNAVVLKSLGDVMLLYCVAENNWRYTIVTAGAATIVSKGLVNQAIAQPNIEEADLINITTFDVEALATYINNNVVPLVNAIKASQNNELQNQRTSGQQAGLLI